MKLAENGCDVALVDKFMIPPTIRPEDKDWRGMLQIKEDIEALGQKAIAIEADLGVDADCLKIVDETVAAFGDIDYFVNCAGFRGPMKDLLEYPIEKYRQVMDININGVFVLSQAVAKVMVKNPAGKKIVLFASQGGTEPAFKMSAYGISKAAAIALGRSLALELAPYGINVNSISPMAFDTNFRDAAKIQQAEEQGISIEESMKKDVALGKGGGPVIPIGRHGTPEDAANMVLFLISEASSYVTGQNILMNGGHKMQ
ncbi:MAG: SDR family oxidoreductase [Mogibacterium sp.]|nr:SDR family oxidoreductase [Mogibacterium sp.]